MTAILMILMFSIAVFLILVVLVQRGRGGGLAGAFGGMGGQSAFGTKAGDLFTRITIVVAAIWIVLCMACVKYFNIQESFDTNRPGATQGAPSGTPGGATPPGGETSKAPTGEPPANSPTPGGSEPAPTSSSDSK